MPSPASSTPRQLVVSFHDLHPGTQATCAAFLEKLAAVGVPRATLLVVPRWHGAPPCSENREFTAWLRRCVAAGHEACLHAFTHRADAVTGNAVQRAVGRNYTAGEGEFYRIARADADARLQAGLDVVVRGCAVPVWGFTAPAWLLGNDARAALRAAGFRYTTGWGSVEILGPGTRLRAPTLVWSSRAGWRRACSRRWVRLWGAINRAAPVLRIAVHPADLAHPAVESSVFAAIARHLPGRQPACYRHLLPEGTPPVAWQPPA